MGDGRTDLFRNMWTKTTTNDVKSDWEYSDTQVKSTTSEEGKAAQEQQYLDIDYMPDQRMHRIVSFVKSGFRIVGAILGMAGNIPAAFGLFFLAEVVGIYEELV
jgi:hypothetical protein